ncbi:hypothetical protein TGAM01_v204873 [Trichoderma gamsii]|uniref:Zn(2)-C6 fungal-type domain-containing protein n=2 Tax=Trichoderma gamsii TaxID=398673 RepID=A0A2P4ZQ15_9HYPO|nr:hypothetical protein TGAM01_v204873 [Trichoderma gamsii]PON26397.1 hypothetical protein TGAM01_v204873 [Trichoderma gamsii]
MLSTRKKSCAACVAGKRRCDLDLPTCARCKRAKKECVYPWMAFGSPDQTLGLNSSPTSAESGIVQDVNGIWAASANNSSNSEDGNLDAVSGHLSPHPSLTVPSPLVPGLLSQLDGYISQNQDQAVLSLGPSPRLMHALSSGQQSPASDYSTPEFIYFDISNTPPTIGAVFQSRTEYAADRLASQPQMLAMTGHNCFIHHTQVSSSEVLQEALAASALHCMRNTANAALVRGEVAKRVVRLIGSIRHAITSASDDAAASGGVGRGLDLLPVLQALVVYQCIRYFARDDVSERMRAERDEAIVQSLLAALYPRLRSFSKSIDSWDAWIYYESMRRTILTAEILSGTYLFLKQGWDQVEGRTLQLQFTAQVALWTAKSAVEWEAMRTRGPKLEVTMQSWIEDTREALPEDLDDLGHVIWALHHGLELMKNWQGGKAEGRWGLQPVMESWS